MASLKQTLQVSRVQTAGVTAFALWVGYLLSGGRDATEFVFLGLIGLLVHVWGFTMNEVEDASYDATHGSGTHLIASGDVSKESAELLSYCSIAAAFLLYVWVGPAIGVLTLALSTISGYAYNKKSKGDPYVGVYLSLWAFLLMFSGAYVGGGFGTLALYGSIILSIQIFVQVLEGDMKDIGGPEKSLANKLGAYFDRDSGTVYVPIKLAVVVIILKSVEGLLVISIIATNIVELVNTVAGNIVVLLVTVAYMVSAITPFKNGIDRDEIKHQSSIHELISVTFIGVAIMTEVLVWGIVVVVIPIIWFIGCNQYLYGNALNPDI